MVAILNEILNDYLTSYREQIYKSYKIEGETEEEIFRKAYSYTRSCRYDYVRRMEFEDEKLHKRYQEWIGVYELKTDLDFDYENTPGYDCEFVIKASGGRDKCNAFFERLKYICPTTVMTDEECENKYTMFLEGDCRLSVRANFINNPFTGDIFRLFSNELFIQAFARNPGEGFREHYTYKYGVCLRSIMCKYTDSENWVYFD